jgi:hypothetical protein
MSARLSSDNATIGRRGFAPLRRSWTSLFLLASVATLVGCGESWVEVFPVSGTVKFDGQTPHGAQIVLHPVAPPGPDAVAPTGSVNADGSFVITSYTNGDGAPPGEYAATIQWYKFDEKLGGPGGNVLPAEYATPKTTPIKVSVQAGGPTQLEPITIASAKTARRPAARPR